MKNRNVVRVVVLAALFAWPALESYRYYSARQALAQSRERLALVSHQLAQVRQQHEPAVMKASLKVQ